MSVCQCIIVIIVRNLSVKFQSFQFWVDNYIANLKIIPFCTNIYSPCSELSFDEALILFHTVDLCNLTRLHWNLSINVVQISVFNYKLEYPKSYSKQLNEMQVTREISLEDKFRPFIAQLNTECKDKIIRNKSSDKLKVNSTGSESKC